MWTFDQRLSEDSLAKLYGVSRTPIREAVFQLMQDGLITKKDNSHFWVKRPTEEELEEVAEVRILLTNLLIDKLIANCDDQLLHEFEKNIESCKRFLAEGDELALNYALSEFHDIMYTGAKSPCIEKILKGMVDQVLLGRAIALKFPGVRRLLVTDHEKILGAIKKRDKVEAKTWMKEHMLNTKKKALEALLRDRLREISGDVA
jgi:DNA-binding GntR family transcriptional regulator